MKNKRKAILCGFILGFLLLAAGCAGKNGDLPKKQEGKPQKIQTDSVDKREEAARDVQEPQEEGHSGDVEADIKPDRESASPSETKVSDEEEEMREAGMIGEEEFSEETEGEAKNPSGEIPEDTGRKKLSIMGDSISTYDGWVPQGYYDFYPLNGEVKDVEQTWWKMLLHDMEESLELCVNASSSGSTCVGDSASTSDPQSGCSDYRIAGLTGADGRMPDIIILYMGTNDVIQNIPIGGNDGTQVVAEGSIENFSDAYCLILDKLATRYPDAQILCCNLMPIGQWGTEAQPFVTFRNGEGLISEDYSARIETIARNKGYPVIDLLHCGITVENMPQYVSDGVHLNTEGMKLVRDAVKTAVSGIAG